MRRCALAVAVAATLPALACSRTGNVDGDVYLRMESGDVKPMAATTVYFAPGQRAATLANRMLGFCHTFEQSFARVSDSSKFYRAAMARDVGNDRWETEESRASAFIDTMGSLAVAEGESVALYKRVAATDSSGTDIRGHYTFANLPAGPGMIWADVSVGNHSYHWVKRVDVPKRAQLRADLDNSLVAEGGDCPGTHFSD